MRKRFYIACDQCDREFGGPEAGEYDEANYDGAASSVFAMLAGEALDLGWIRVIWYGEDVLLCSPPCVADWLSKERVN